MAVRWPRILTPKQLSQRIKSQKNPLKALQIFDEAKCKYPTYRHNGPVYGTMINILGRSGRIAEMTRIINQMKDDSCEYHDSIFVSAIRSYAEAGLTNEAFSLFKSLPEFNCIDWTESLNTLLDILVQESKLESVYQLFLENSSGWEVKSRASFLNLLMNILCRMKRSDLALHIFQEMSYQGCYPNKESYGILMRGLCEEKRLNEATHLLYSMFWRISQKGSGEDAVVYRILLDALCDNEEDHEAIQILGKVLRKGLKAPKRIYKQIDHIPCQSGADKEGIKVLINEALIKGVVPSSDSYRAMAVDFFSEGKIDEGNKVLKEMHNRGFKPSVGIYEAKIAALFREGQVDLAIAVINSEMVQENCVPNVRLYNAVIKGLCDERNSRLAVEYLKRMSKQVGCVPNHETYETLVDGLCKEAKMKKEAKSSYFDMPALDVSVAFPQATPASKFPPCTSDYYQLDDLLTPEEKAIRMKVRECMEKEVAPIMTKYWEKAEFPFEVVPKLGALHVAGGTIKGFGCPGMSITASAVAGAEVARVDASCSTFILVHSSLAMLTIGLCGSEMQKQKYLPSLAELNTIACWGLTEPDNGSDASGLITTARKVEGGWILDGQKRWIGNSTFADILVIFARNTSTNQINGFIVKKDAPGLQATKIENKIGLRMVQNGDILFNKVFVPDEDRLPGVNSFQDTNKVLAVSRVMVAWQPIGITMGVYDMCHRYLKERKQFGAPLAAFQINQQKLVQMLSNIQAMILVGWRLCKLYESGKMTPGHASLGKSWITLRARETVSLGRELLGGNGILADFQVAKAFCDLEPIYTYEGTYDINTLVTGREITGIASFKPAATRQKSRL